ncbi:hypothetical protein IM660_10570 [Ruania alkalisoli]|uniref:Protein kinase domain-containing protein n=1 Tax=Ruania alkalisoli TaxID=2779775 RepID=A0A7M1SP16_9MICO|nr:hypothetical protein [Ruania alkalisoli]QOR69171.1 hypothetical protein IM660_10570 [Ruania alkalisoli]
MVKHVRVPGYNVTGLAGAGGRDALWKAQDASGRTVVLRVIRVSCAEEGSRLRRRWEALRELPEGGVARAVASIDMPNGDVAVASEYVDGPTVGTLRTARDGLTAPECLSLAARLLRTLASLHAAGIVHGDIAPSNVLLAPARGSQNESVRPELDGDRSLSVAGVRPVLVDVSALPERECGTPGFQAPEVSGGARPGAPADVYGVAAVAVHAASDGERSRVLDALTDLLADDAARRPVAQDAADQLRSYDTPIRPAEPRILAAATLRNHAARTATALAPTHRRRVARHRRRRWRPGLTIAAAIVLLTAVVMSELHTGPGPLPRTGLRTAIFREQDLVARVAELTALRDEALQARDHDLLAALTVPGSDAAAADAALLAALHEADVEIEGLTSTASGIEILDVGPDEARAQMMLSQTAYERHGPDGTLSFIEPVEGRCTAIEMGLVEHAWRVSTVQPCAT